MNLVKLFAFILIFGCSAVVNSQEQGPRAPATPSPVAQEIATDEQTDEAAMAQLIREKQELLYAKDIAEIRADLLDAQSSWYEILTSILMGGFGLVVTGVVIFFALRFGKAAVEEAKVAAVKAARDELASEQAKINALLKDAGASVAKIKTHEKSAKEMLSGIPTGEAPQDKEKRKGLREIAKSALSKPRRERTADEYRALVMVDLMDEDWAAMERRANAMSVLFDGECSDEDMGFALFNRAFALGELGEPKDALAAYDTLIERFGASDDIRLQEQVANALLGKGVRLGKLNRPKDALAAYGAVIERFGASDDIRLQERVANALLNKGVRHGELGEPKDALAAYDTLIERFGASDDIRLQVPVAGALSNKGVRLGVLGRSEDAIAVYDTVIERFGDSDDIRLQGPVAGALFNKGVRLGVLGRSEDALAVYDTVIERFGDSDAIRLQGPVAKALFNKACSYALMERVRDAIDSLDQWQMRVGHLDCDKIAQDTDFDKIRERPTFKKFLKDNGCDPGAGPDSN